VHVTLECTLEELYVGCIKEIEYSRTIYTLDSQIVPSKETKLVEVKPGYKCGQKIVLEGEGSMSSHDKFKDLIITIKQLPHTHYERKGDDLLYKHDISLIDALNSASCKFKTFDGRVLNISVDEIISPHTVRIVEDEGMPIYDAEEEKIDVTRMKKGKLFIIFNIHFPKKMSEEKKMKIVNVLNTPSIEPDE
jgi:DnaJ-class molecular chaperone